MSDSTEAKPGALKTGTYTKGDQTRLVETQADAVAAVFDGFSIDEDTAGETAPASESDTPTPDKDSAQETTVSTTDVTAPVTPTPSPGRFGRS